MLSDTLLGSVIAPRSSYLGLLLDVRHGPTAFGQKARGDFAALLARGEELGFPMAVLVSQSATQRLQFNNLRSQCAPLCGTICLDDASLPKWWG
jgi:hypothetical protein